MYLGGGSFKIHREVDCLCEQTMGRCTTTVPCVPCSTNSSLLKSLWAEAFSTATDVQNRMQAKALDRRTLHEVLYSVQLGLADLWDLTGAQVEEIG